MPDVTWIMYVPCGLLILLGFPVLFFTSKTKRKRQGRNHAVKEHQRGGPVDGTHRGQGSPDRGGPGSR